jgi:hypothetical protein
MAGSPMGKLRMTGAVEEAERFRQAMLAELEPD